MAKELFLILKWIFLALIIAFLFTEVLLFILGYLSGETAFGDYVKVFFSTRVAESVIDLLPFILVPTIIIFLMGYLKDKEKRHLKSA